MIKENFTDANLMAHIAVTGKEDLVRKLCLRAAELPYIKDRGLDYEGIYSSITEREKLASTEVGSGFVIPHARFDAIDEVEVVIATLQPPLPADNSDGKELEIACLLLIPAAKPMEGLKFMARFARFLAMPELREHLLEARSPEEMRLQLKRINEASRRAVAAEDIMTPCAFSLTADMPLKEATVLMARAHNPIAPVLEGRKLIGQISSAKLFTLGIPDFFSQLKSVSFIRYFDPFDKYFTIEANSCVGSVMDKDYCVFHGDATLVEIVFAISILKYPQVYIVDKDDNLLGIIDQALLLERIINL